MARKGIDCREISRTSGSPYHQVRNHVANHVTKVAAPLEERAPAPPAPDLTTTVTERDRVDAHCKWLYAKIQWAEKAGEDLRGIAQLSREYSNSTRLLAKLNGAFDVTETHIVRSQPFKRIMGILVGVLEKHPVALAELNDRLTELDVAGHL